MSEAVYPSVVLAAPPLERAAFAPEVDQCVESVAVEVKPGRGNRWHHLDALRGMLMVLGIAIHAGYIYSARGGWLLHDPTRSVFFDALTYGIHLFRLPCFFMISGFLAVVVLKQKGLSHFLWTRTRRLAVPFIAAALLLNSFQAWLLAWYTDSTFWAYYSGSGWVSHLWFLIDLLIYTYVLVVLWPLLAHLQGGEPPALGGAVVLIVPLVSVALPTVIVRGLGIHGPIAGFFDLYEMLYYATFFAFGVLYQPGKDDARDRLFFSWTVPLLVVAVTAKSAFTQRLIVAYADAALSWSCALICLGIGKVIFQRPAPCLRALADASYTIYLFHHLIVIALGMIFILLPTSIWLEYVLIVAITLGLTLAIHRYLIQRSSWLRFLFNGS